MLEIGKTAVSFDERDLMELERIVNDGDEKEALAGTPLRTKPKPKTETQSKSE